MCGNITRHGRKDVTFLRHAFDHLDAWAFCEMHVHGTDVEKVQRLFLREGWNSRIAPGQVRQESNDRDRRAGYRERQCSKGAVASSPGSKAEWAWE